MRRRGGVVIITSRRLSSEGSLTHRRLSREKWKKNDTKRKHKNNFSSRSQNAVKKIQNEQNESRRIILTRDSECGLRANTYYTNARTSTFAYTWVVLWIEHIYSNALHDSRKQLNQTSTYPRKSMVVYTATVVTVLLFLRVIWWIRNMSVDTEILRWVEFRGSQKWVETFLAEMKPSACDHCLMFYFSPSS